MVVVMTIGAFEKDIDFIRLKLSEAKLPYQETQSGNRYLFTIAADPEAVHALSLESCPGVEQVLATWTPLALVGRKNASLNTVVNIDGVTIGKGDYTIIAGPCAVESENQIIETAQYVAQAGADMLRGGAFKPRTSPYSFQGLGQEGLELLKKAKGITGLPIVTEVMSTDQLNIVASYADMLQIGARNMQNYTLLQAVGEQSKPVLLKRGMSATIDEWLSAAEYIVSRGNSQVVLCERGIRTFSRSTRNTLDLSAVPIIKSRSHLPIIVDPSHATGHWRLVEPMALAAIAAGADGIMVEVHPNPESALSDGSQSLKPHNFAHMIKRLRLLADALKESQ